MVGGLGTADNVPSASLTSASIFRPSNGLDHLNDTVAVVHGRQVIQGVGRHEDHTNTRVFSYQTLRQLSAEHTGHSDIAEYKVDWLGKGAGDGEHLIP